MTSEDRIKFSLFFLRISIFFVLLIWTLDKFLNPAHAAKVFDHFYFIKGLGALTMALIGGIELIIISLFVLGIKKRISYGLVLFFHSISTVTSFPMYLKPFALPNMLFFAAIPMLAGCFALYLLRDLDTKFTV